jgi:hypothetical protein
MKSKGLSNRQAVREAGNSLVGGRLHNESAEVGDLLYDRSGIPQDLHPYSNRSEGTFYFPEETQLRSYRIVVCTLINSGR